jgi:hypothetical protein
MTNQASNKSFILHKDSLEILDQLSDDQAGKLFKAIFSYQKTGEIGNVDQLVKIAINPFVNQFKRDEEKYKNVVERNKINGLKGGRPKNPTKPNETQRNPVGYLETQNNPTKPKKPDSDSKNKSDSESKKESELYISKNNFDEFWQFYTPIAGRDGTFTSKGSKVDATKAYEKAIKKFSHEQIMQCLKVYLTFCQKNMRFTKNVASWLNQSMKDNFEIENDVFIKADKPKQAFMTRQQLQQQQDDEIYSNLMEEYGNSGGENA